ncbi:TDT family transporter [Fuscibacter oryzae]|uniref:Tellurium resistance protein n=1 Tax=Fuscibacter oryzae TaxID=2803939 RepID=A0A8J7SSW9_9RHOB|nr:tellurium resistance protein [Fuscibacter oryzae]MBL4928025.1 tellurium resistance protein [Fuscibacter oryzae]
MSQAPQIDRRPKRFPPPEFPPRRAALFAKTPPAVFPVVLGLLGLGLALRRGLAGTALAEPLEALNGGLLGLWLFAVLALLGKVLRRPGVVVQDLRVLPGRAGLAAATMSGMVAASLILPFVPGLAVGLALVSLTLHAVLAGLLIATLLQMPPEAREVNPTWHLSFVGFIVGAVPLALAGWTGVAQAILMVTLVAAAVIWAVSLAQLIRRIPPAPLRPLLAIHLSPAALFATVASLLGQPVLAQAFAAFGAVILLALVIFARWITLAGFSAMWGALTFPLAAYASALIVTGGGFALPGLAVLVAATLLIPPIAWNVLKLWPGGRLAARTNAAEA